MSTRNKLNPLRFGTAPSVEAISRAEHAIDRLILKFGTERYRKDRDKASRVVQKALANNGIIGTLLEEFVRLELTCRVIGKDRIWLDDNGSQWPKEGNGRGQEVRGRWRKKR